MYPGHRFPFFPSHPTIHFLLLMSSGQNGSCFICALSPQNGHGRKSVIPTSPSSSVLVSVLQSSNANLSHTHYADNNHLWRNRASPKSDNQTNLFSAVKLARFHLIVALRSTRDRLVVTRWMSSPSAPALSAGQEHSQTHTEQNPSRM